MSLLRAIAQADLPSFLSGPPHNPNLKPGKGSDYSSYRDVERLYAHTAIEVRVRRCRVCGKRAEETHILGAVAENGDRRFWGQVTMCRNCQKDSWLFVCHSPRAIAGRKRDAKVLL